jgi:hypothetical protein
VVEFYGTWWLLQYDEAQEFVERARKCLATELAALVIHYSLLLKLNFFVLRNLCYQMKFQNSIVKFLGCNQPF